MGRHVGGGDPSEGAAEAAIDPTAPPPRPPPSLRRHNPRVHAWAARCSSPVHQENVILVIVHSEYHRHHHHHHQHYSYLWITLGSGCCIDESSGFTGNMLPAAAAAAALGSSSTQHCVLATQESSCARSTSSHSCTTSFVSFPHESGSLRCCQKSHFGFDSSKWSCWKKRLRLTRAARDEGGYHLEPDPRSSVLAIILGGGAGSRLHPLTKERAKPAVPLGANYRLIDIPISNCINSNIPRIYVLTQYNSTSLNSHLYRAYAGNMGGFKNNGFVDVLAAEQSLDNPDWFRGTADAVRQCLWVFQDEYVLEFLILAGDHLYRMDYQKFIMYHRQRKADITVAAVPVTEKRATSFGLMKIDLEGKITEFAEKPKGKALQAMKVDTKLLGLDSKRAAQMPYIASMGIYVFSKKALYSLLRDKFPLANDFGSEIIPNATELGMKVQAYLFDGYWEDIGTIDAFYNANIGLTKTPPEFSFDNSHAPIYTLPRCLPPSVLHDADIVQSIIGEGCVIQNCKIYHSVVGLRSRISEGAVVEDALIMGADFYEGEDERDALVARGGIPIGIGKYSTIRKAIIDKNVRIGRNVRIINADNVMEAAREADGYFIRNGIVTILKDAVIPNGTTI